MLEFSQGGDWENAIDSFAGAATAIATIALVAVTIVLAWATRNMAHRSSLPQVVAVIESNQWAINHADLAVSNTGNASAFDIQLEFVPPLPSFRNRESSPFSSISVLLPGQRLHSHVNTFSEMFEKYEVTVTWRRTPGRGRFEHLRYTLDINELKNVARLGKSTPFVQIAEEIKKMQEEVHRVFSGNRRLSVDIYSTDDRERERKKMEEWYNKVISTEESSTDDTKSALPTKKV